MEKGRPSPMPEVLSTQSKLHDKNSERTFLKSIFIYYFFSSIPLILVSKKDQLIDRQAFCEEHTLGILHSFYGPSWI